MASSLSFRSALGLIEQAIHRVIRWKYLIVTATVSDIAALRAYATQSASGNATPEYTAIFVTSLGLRVEWLSASTTADDSATYFKPTDVTGSNPGRWRITTSTAATGYLATVHYWDGETKKSEFQARILAARPSVAVVWEGSDNDPRSNIPGAIYDYTPRFSLWCIDENLRPRYESFFGSEYAYDGPHPGVIAILGDIKKALADQNKREVNQADSSSGILSLGGGVKSISLGAEDMEDADLDGRVMILSIAVEVFASVENPDDDSEHVAVTSLYLQPDLTRLNQQSTLDPLNYVVSGYAFDTGNSLTATIASGTAVIAGATVTSSPVAYTFGAFADTYCDLLPAGTVTYIAAGNNGAAPAVTAMALRLGKVVTDSMGITEYDPIAAVSAAFGPNRRIVPDPGAT